MHRPIAIILAALLASSGASSAPPTTCTRLGTVEGRPVSKTADGLITFTANMDVNTDGTLQSYGVDDLGTFAGGRLNTTSALNTICNGVRIRERVGTQDRPVYNHTQCGNLIREFQRIRAAGWATTDGRYVDFFAIATRPGSERPGRHRGIPCEKDGYYVSQTARPMNPALPVCDPDHWIDAARIPAIVVPINLLRAQGVGLFDAVMVRRAGGDRWFPAIVGDTNEAKLGEATLRLAQQIVGDTTRPANYRALLRVQPRGDYDYVIFPGSRRTLATRSNAMEPTIMRSATDLATSFRLATRPQLCP